MLQFRDRFDAAACRSMWLNVLCPGINRQRWTEEEDSALEMLVEKYNMRNWDAIATELKVLLEFSSSEKCCDYWISL